MSMTFNLSTFQWKNRLLLVVAPSQLDADYQQQRQLLDGSKAGFRDRHLLLIELFDHDQSRLGGDRIDAETAQEIRDRFSIRPNEFAVLLIGKDGTMKTQYSSPVEPATVFQEIDAMPMRQQEMQQQQ